MKAKTLTIKPLRFETYIALIQNSLGTTMFRNVYALVNGKKKDILEDGELSCAYYVSSILRIHGLIGQIHTTVAGTIKDLEKSGWKHAKKPSLGSVLVWEPGAESNGHGHIGFYLGNDVAVSNSSKKGLITKHHATYGNSTSGPKRPIVAIYTYKF